MGKMNTKRNKALREQRASQRNMGEWLGLPPTAAEDSQLNLDETGSSSVNQLKTLEEKMKKMEVSQGMFQEEIRKTLNSMAQSLQPRQHISPSLSTRLPQASVEQTRNPDIYAQLLYEGSKQQAFMQAHALLKPLHGNEGRSKIESYFRTFEAMTRGWSSERQADLLTPHLESQARLAYESLGANQQLDYDTIKEAIIHGRANTSSFRIEAQIELKRLRQNPGESLLDFGLRVLQLTRDSMLPETPEEIVEDQAWATF